MVKIFKGEKMRWTRNDQTAAEVGGFIIKFIVVIIALAYIFSWVS